MATRDQPADEPAKSIFLDALEIASERDRLAYLDRRCGQDAVLRAEVETLLRHHEGLGDYLERPAVGPPPTREAARRPAAEAAGAIIGPYKLIQEIGEGGFQYSVATLDGDKPVGGIGAIPAAAPADVPSHWMAYFAVADADAAADRVTALGGTVRQPPFDTPYGRMALVAGPQGETFSVMQLPEQPTAD